MCAANINTNLSAWSTTASSNQPDTTDLASTLREDLQAIQAGVRLLRSAGSISSAATTNLASVNEEIVTVSGTATITSLGTVSAGMIKVLVFSGAATLTHDGTALILPGGANISVAAGDVGTFLSLGSGNWRCLSYQRANGYPVLNTWDKVSTQTVSGASSVTITGLSSTYPRYRLVITDLVFSVDSGITLGSGAGSYDSGNNYQYYWNKETFAGTSSTGNSNAVAAIVIVPNMDSTPQAHSLDVDLCYLGSRLQATWQCTYHDAGGIQSVIRGGGIYTCAGTVDRALLIPNAGNISGTFTLYGLR